MFNLTISALSLSSIYLTSPLFTGNGNNFINLNIQRYFPIIFFNMKSLQLKGSTFHQGFGSIIRTNSDDVNTDCKNYFDQTYENDNLNINLPTAECLYTIIDCKFLNIDVSQSSSELIKIGIDSISYPTFYMTDCIFYSCKAKNQIILLNSRATSISHICCSNTKSSFFCSDTPTDSFFKFIYSTITGIDQTIEQQLIFNFQGDAAMKFQCMNVSSFKLKTGQDYGIIRFVSASCAKILMNTFENLCSGRTIWYNLQSKNTTFTHLISMNNFIKNPFGASCIFFDTKDNHQAKVSDCKVIFTDDSNCKFVIKSGNGVVTVNNCFFNKQYIQGELPIDFKDCKVGEVQTFTLGHFFTDEYCERRFITDAHGCQKDECYEDNIGCPADAFNFKPDDNPYSEKYHPDIDTPPPTDSYKFTKSDVFSISTAFSNSYIFSESNDFSNSYIFSNSNDFSMSDIFSNSNDFSMSDAFSFSSAFSQSMDIQNQPEQIDPNHSKQQDKDDKLKTGEIAGIAVGCVAALAIVAGLIAFFALKKKNKLNDGSEADVMDIDNSTVTTNNNLKEVMKNDDPFAEEFND